MKRQILMLAAVLVIAPASLLAQAHPLFEPYFGYSILKVNLPDKIDGEDTGLIQSAVGNLLGWNGGLTIRVKGKLGAVADFAGFYRKFQGEIDGDTVDASANLHTFLFGPRFSGSGERFRPFGQALFGAGRLSGSAAFDSDKSNLDSNTGFAASFGGGVDVSLNKSVAMRASLDFFPVKQSNEGINNGNSITLRNFRFGTGIVFRLK